MCNLVSYRELIRLPNVLSLLSATCLARLAVRMFSVAIVFYALAAFHSPVLAGWISFAILAPGLAVSPLAGAFLDRVGARRGVVVDLAVSAALMLTLAASIALEAAGPALLLVLSATYALTSPLSAAGVRVLLPRLVPKQALDKANALDTTIHGIVDVVGPSLAGALVGLANPVAPFVLIAIIFAAATTCVALVHDVAPPRH